MAPAQAPSEGTDAAFGKVEALCSDLHEIYDSLRGQINTSVKEMNSYLTERPEAFQYQVWARGSYQAEFATEAEARIYGEFRFTSSFSPFTYEIRKEQHPSAVEAHQKLKEHQPLLEKGRQADFDEISAAIDTVFDIGRYLSGVGAVTQPLFDLADRIESASKTRAGGGENDHPDIRWSGGGGADLYKAARAEFADAITLTYETTWNLIDRVTNLLTRIATNLNDLANLGVEIEQTATEWAASLASSLNPLEWVGIVNGVIDAYNAHTETKTTMLTSMADTVSEQVAATVELAKIAQGISDGWPKVDGRQIATATWAS